jgi:Domain of unknown function (DUF1707)
MAEPPAVRVSDADRERVVNELREHTVSGRLTLEEFSERAELALHARTSTELEAVTAELPRLAPPKGKVHRWMLTLIGSEQRQGRWQVPERVTAISLFGAPDLDFRQAVIGSPEVTITSISLVGALTAIIPAGIEVELRGLALVGGNDLSEEGVVDVAGGPTVKIRSFALFGGARVTRVR